MFENLKEKFGKTLFVTIIVLIVLASYGAGFINGKFLSKNEISQSSSFFDRNQKEIAEGFIHNIAENDDMMEVQSINYKKGEIHLIVDSKRYEFDEIEYVLTENNIQVIYKSNIEVDEDDYKQLINGEIYFDAND